MGVTDSTARFSGRAEAYARCRPGYPPDLLAHLRSACGLLPSHIVADVGSGTGKLTELFLSNGNTVRAVEPNREMRAEAERLLGGSHGFCSVEGRAEATGLPPRSVNVVAAGQAFHWFDPARTREEFRRILRTGGFVVLVWNVRHDDASPFLGVYEAFLREYSAEYEAASHRRLTDGDALRGFFSADYGTASFPNPRRLDFQSVKGGYLSTSYALAVDHPEFGRAMERLRAIFDAHQENGMVNMPLRTEVYHGKI